MERDVGRNESDDTLWLTVIFTVAAALAAVWVGGWLAALVVGADLGVSPAKVIGVIAGIVSGHEKLPVGGHW